MKSVFGFFGLTIEKASVNLRKAEFNLEKASEKSTQIGSIVEGIDGSLKLYQSGLTIVGAFAELWSRSLQSNQQNFEKAGSLIPLPAEVDLLVGGDPSALEGLFNQAANTASSNAVNETSASAANQGVEPPTFELDDLPNTIDATLFAERLARMQFQSDAQLSAVAESIQDITEQVEAIGDELMSIIDALVNNDIFKTFEKFEKIVSDALAAIEPVFSPLEEVADALGPVLDALGSIFGFILKPLEFVLNAVIEATGIKSVISDLTNEITALLPDFGIFDGIVAQIEKTFIVDFPNDIAEKVTKPLKKILDDLNAPDFPASLTTGNEFNNTLTGPLSATGPLMLDGKAADDNLFGREFDDTLIGGDGSDFLSGGAGNDFLDGGDNPFVVKFVPDKLYPIVLVEQTVHEPDFVIYEGNRDDYGIVAEVAENGDPTGLWVIQDNRTDAQIAASDTQVNNGIDTLKDIEIIFWDDTFLDLTAFDTFIETKSADGAIVSVSPNSSDIPPVAGITPVTSNGNDLVIGNLGLDFILTGPGNDQLNSGTNGPLTRAFAVGDILFGEEDDDVYVADYDSARYDYIEDSSGIDTIDLSGHRGAIIGQNPDGTPRYEDIPLNVFLGSTDREEFYRPTSINIDIDTIGTTLNPNLGLFSFDIYNAGVARGVENIIGTQFSDVLYGTDGVNVINAGDGDDQVRGLAGDDFLFGGLGDDSLIGDGGMITSTVDPATTSTSVD